jgi:hypothetical protein
MSVVSTSVAGAPRIVAATAPLQGQPNLAVIAAMHLGGAHETSVLGVLAEQENIRVRRHGNHNMAFGAPALPIVAGS